MGKLYFAVVLLLIFRKNSCTSPPLIFCDALSISGVRIGGNLSEFILFLFEWYGHIQQMPQEKFFNDFSCILYIKQIKIFREHKYAFVEIRLWANMIMQKYALSKCIDCLLFFKPCTPSLPWGMSFGYLMRYPFKYFKKTFAQKIFGCSTDSCQIPLLNV